MHALITHAHSVCFVLLQQSTHWLMWKVSILLFCIDRASLLRIQSVLVRVQQRNGSVRYGMSTVSPCVVLYRAVREDCVPATHIV